MIGLFVTALVGVYTVEDLWEKFGDVKLSVVRGRMRSSLEIISWALTARSSSSLGCPRRLPYRRSCPRLHGIIQDPLYGLEPFRTWRCSNELAVPGQFGWQ